ncbi:MAG: hypothetical protein R3F08_06655 [Dokdonella sp.]
MIRIVFLEPDRIEAEVLVVDAIETGTGAALDDQVVGDDLVIRHFAGVADIAGTRIIDQGRLGRREQAALYRQQAGTCRNRRWPTRNGLVSPAARLRGQRLQGLGNGRREGQLPV